MSQKTSMQVLYTNARSLRNKLDEFKALIASNKYDIIAVTETWANCVDRDFRAEFDIGGYTLFNKDRVGRRGGGIMIYCNKEISCEEIELRNNNPDLEILVIKIKSKNSFFNFVTIYRPPNQSAETDSQFYQTLTELAREDCVLLGDFNVADYTQLNDASSQAANDLTKFVEDNFLSQSVDEPTRGNNVLDLVFSTQEDMIQKLHIGDNLSTSDHKIITFVININTERSIKNHFVPDFRRSDFNGFRNELETINWDSLFTENDAESNYIILKERLKTIEHKYIPMKLKRNENNPRWFNREIKDLVHGRDRAHKASSRNPTENNKKNYQNLKRQVKRKIKIAKRNFEKSIADNSKRDPKRFYSYVSCKKSVKETIGPIENSNGEKVTNVKEMASVLNNFFASVFTQELTDSPNPAVTREFQENEKLTDINVNDVDLATYIEKINNNKTPGPDNIYPRELKELKNVLINPLSKVFNDSLSTGKVPADFKIANITPIFKKGDKSLPSNYRPISLTSIAGKLLESVIRDKIVEHLDNYNLIRDSQHGFRRNKSCLTNLLQFYNTVIEDYDENSAADIIYLDFQKAFDTVPHKRLIKKLKAHGIDGKVADWIEDWLKDRKQRVVIEGEGSEYINVTSGVPQGSVLGPLLFIIYVNDLDVDLTSNLVKFADDTKISGKGNTEKNCAALQRDLDILLEWSRRWGLDFNISKCKVLQVGSNNANHVYTLGGRPLERTRQEKDLGVIVSSDLKNHSQCAEQCKKANRILGFISRNFEYKSKDIILPLYKSLVRPQLEYAVQFWSPYLNKDIELLERVQRRATKMIPNLRNMPYEERLRMLRLPKLESRRLRGEMIEVFKILKGFEKVDSRQFFHLSEVGITRNNGLKIQVKRFRTNIAKNFFTYKVVNHWNRLPQEVVNAPSINSFKNRLDKYMKWY